MSNVVSLVTYKNESNYACIDYLKEMLELAESGELVEVAIAGVLFDGSSITGHTPTNNVQLQIGALEILKHKLIIATVE